MFICNFQYYDGLHHKFFFFNIFPILSKHEISTP